MILADFGAQVTRIDRVGAGINNDMTAFGKRSIALDLKRPESVEIMTRMTSSSDVLLEPFRPGVMERLGLGPRPLTELNERLVYARLSGFGQEGPFSQMAGHDINYSALSGVLSWLGRKGENPLPPVNLLADFAGGSFLCAMGIMAALLERGTSGKGQVIDSNMTEGAAYVGTWLFASKDYFVWGKSRGENFLDSGSHFYETYETADGKYMSVGALEPQFYQTFLDKLGLTDDDLPQFGDWAALKEKTAAVFLTRTQAEWSALFDGSDACVVPVLGPADAASHPHNVARGSFLEDGLPRPAPRLSRTPPERRGGNPRNGEHSKLILQECGYTDVQIADLLASKVVEC